MEFFFYPTESQMCHNLRGAPHSDAAMCIVILKGLNCLAVTYSVTDLISKALAVFQNGNEFHYLQAHWE
jgi:hypothetical protein